jgi:UDP-N-acetyl-D-mannosaminuronate dehydrogenase
MLSWCDQTVPAGTTQERLAPALQAASGRCIGNDLELCCNPEFLREGSAVRDFYHPPFNMIGSVVETGPLVTEQSCRDMQSLLIRTSWSIAESVKYVCNACHALKITFANEVVSLSQVKGIDSRRVIEVFCQDSRINLSGAYLRPGFAIGGSCLAKDTRALVHLARTSNVKTCGLPPVARPTLLAVPQSAPAEERFQSSHLAFASKARSVCDLDLLTSRQCPCHVALPPEMAVSISPVPRERIPLN